MEVIDLEDESSERVLKACVYGRPGTGKTGFGVSAPRPLILLNERQAIPHIRAAAKRLNRPMPKVLIINEMEDYRRVLRALRGDRTKPFVVVDGAGKVILSLDEWPASLVIDSITEACDLAIAEIRRESPPKNGRDGLPVDSERFWNVLRDRMSNLIRAFRDVPLNVLFLALLEDKLIGEDDEKSRWVGPRLAMRSLPEIVAASVNVVGITYRKRSNDKREQNGDWLIEYGIATTGPTYMETKPLRPLRDYEVMDFASWCERYNGRDDGSVAPAPMEVAPNTAADVVPEKPAEKPAEQKEPTERIDARAEALAKKLAEEQERSDALKKNEKSKKAAG